MANVRQDKIGRLIQREVAEILRISGGTLSGGGMVTVTAARMSPDLSFAKIFLSIFATDDKEAALENIRKRTSEIKHELAKKTRYQLRKTPNLAFYLDDSLDKAERIDELLK